MDNFSKKGGEGCGIATAIKESIYMRVNNLTINRSIGKYNLPHVWDNILANTPELQIKHQQEQYQQVHRTSLVPPRTSYISVDNNNFPQTWRRQAVCLMKACLNDVIFCLIRTVKNL